MGKSILFTVTPTSDTFVNFISSVAPIAADGSGSFEVQFAGGETLFTFVATVSTS